MPAPTVSLVFKWKPNAAQPNFNCDGDGSTVAGEEVHVVLYVVYEDGSVTGTSVAHNYTKWQEVAGHSNQYAERLNIVGAPPDPDDPCAPTPGPNQLVIAFDWWDVYPPRFHNGSYEVRASYSYTEDGGNPVTPPDVVINATFNDALLTIETPPSPPYFLWDPADPTHSKVTVSFSVSDEQIFPGMTAVLKVYPLERADSTPPLRTQTMSVDVPTSAPVDFAWDGQDDTGNVMPKGIYAYDLHIDDVAGVGSDIDDKISAFLSLAEPIDPETGLPIYEATYIGYDETAYTDDFEVSYVLKDTDGIAASSGKIELYAPDLLMVFSHQLDANDLTASAQGIQHTVTLKVPAAVMEKEGDHRFVISATDNHSNKEKGHRLKPALEINNKAPRLSFNVSTHPPGSSQQGHSGFKVGVQDNTKFYVVIKATLDFKTGKTPPTSVRFLLKRNSTGVKAFKTGYLITDSNDPDGPQVLPGGMTRHTYRTHKLVSNLGVTDWIVTQEKGRWDVKIEPKHDSNTVQFKIDKREQIVQVAESWVNANRNNMLCNAFVGHVYNHVGINVDGSSVTSVWTSTQEFGTQDSTHAVAVFYRSPSQNTGIAWGDGSDQGGTAGHVAIRVKDGNVVDANCALDQYDTQKVHRHTENEPLAKWPGDTPVVGDKKKDRTPPELITLDSE